MAYWSIKDLHESLIFLGVKRGSNVFIHANLGLLGKSDFPIKEVPSTVLSKIEELVGENGSICLPAFTYSAGRKEIFRPYTTQGLREMGNLSSEAFSRSYLRSMDPMFSVLCYGNNSTALLQGLGDNSFGPESFFERAIEMNFRMLLFSVGCGTTFLHEIEKQIGVIYRTEKIFNYEIQKAANEAIYSNTWRSYVRDLEDNDTEADFRLLSTDFIKHPNVFKVQLGKGYIVSYEINTLKSFVFKKLASNPWYLTKKGYLNTESHQI